MVESENPCMEFLPLYGQFLDLEDKGDSREEYKMNMNFALLVEEKG